MLHTFSSEETHSCSAELNSIGAYTRAALRNFNADMTLMTATLTLKSGAMHVGWIDEQGKFTDVSEKVTVESDFGALTKHTHPCFFENYFYFRDITNDNVQIKRVPINNLTNEAVEVMAENCKWNGISIYLLPDGSVVDSSDPFDYYDLSMSYPTRVGNTSEWISDSTIIGNGNGMNDRDNISIKNLSGQTGPFDWYTDSTTLVPEVKNRVNWNPVLSPDGNNVAFLSKLNSGTDRSTNIFIIPATGGEPRKITTDIALDSEIAGMVAWK